MTQFADQPNEQILDDKALAEATLAYDAQFPDASWISHDGMKAAITAYIRTHLSNQPPVDADLRAVKEALDKADDKLEIYYKQTSGVYAGGMETKALRELIADAEASLTAIEAALNKLQQFKEYVHKRLDDAGIPTHPEGEHSKHGCRIGDRLYVALNKPKVSLDVRDRVAQFMFAKWSPESCTAYWHDPAREDLRILWREMADMALDFIIE